MHNVREGMVGRRQLRVSALVHVCARAAARCGVGVLGRRCTGVGVPWRRGGNYAHRRFGQDLSERKRN
jgi:hypothetical protein